MSVPYNPAQATKGAKALFMQELAAQPPSLIDRVATYVSSESDAEDYAWMGEATQMEEAEDELKFVPMSNATYNLRNKKYWGGIALKRDDVNDDKVGGFGIRVREHAQTAARLPNKLITDVLTTNPTGYDATALFSATHPARGQQTATQSNLLTGSGTTVSQIATDVALAVAAMMNFKAENNEPMNEGFTKFFVMYPPALIKAVNEALYAQIVSNTSNVGLKDFTFDLIANPRLTADSAADFYVGIQDALVRGIVFQDREGLSFEAQDGAESDAAFTREEYRYKSRRRCRAGVGRWQRIVKINN